MSSGGTNPGRFQGIDPRGGTEFDKNGPNLTEDIIFAIGTTLVGIEGPEELQSSGIESKAGERSDIISSWRRVAVEHALAKANDGNADRGPVLKVSERADQSIIGLVLRSHGRPRTIGADGCSFVTKRERLGRAVSKRDRDINRLMDKPGGCRLAVKEAQCNWSIQGFQYKGWKSSQRRVQEIGGGSRIDECRYRVRETRESKRDKKRNL